MNDLRFALRQLRKSPGFTFLAVLTLAVGIGMNTAIFSLIQDLFLRGLPFSEPERVVRIYGESKERDLKQMPFFMPKFWHYRDGQTVFSSIAADWGNGFIMTGSGEPIQLLGGNVTANYFELLGIHPILGRNFLPEEESKGDVVMVTENFWRKRFNSDPTILGHNITLNGVPTTIIGVLPNLPISWFGRDSEIFANKPFEPPGLTKDRLMRGVSFMRVTARLKPGVSTFTGAGGDAGIIPKLQRATPGNGRQHLVAVPGLSGGRCHRRFASGFPDTACGSERGIAHRVQQCRELVAGALHGTQARDRVAHGARCGAARNRALIRFRKHAGQRDRRRDWIVSGALDGIGRSEIGWSKHSARKRSKTAIARAHFHTGTIAHHRPAHGPLSGVAKLARRSGRWA